MIVTKAELLNMANSTDANERKRAYKLYQAWVKNGPKMSPLDRLNTMEQHMLKQVFATKGMTVAGPSSIPRKPTSVPRAGATRGRPR
jgi:hypothetical protein